VKIFRLWLLVLIAVLLPIRGAVAAAMPCPNESTPVHHHMGASPDHRMMGHERMADAPQHHLQADGHPDHGHAGHGDKCNLCASCCTGTAMPSSLQAAFEALEPAGESFTAPATPAMSFLSDGQDRPPRSI
jgi:hypothetical protein